MGREKVGKMAWTLSHQPPKILKADGKEGNVVGDQQRQGPGLHPGICVGGWNMVNTLTL